METSLRALAMKIKLFLAFLFLHGFIHPADKIEAAEIEDCLVITIPKAGTHLLVKYFHILLKRQILPYKTWSTTHFFVKDFPQIYRLINESPENKAISLIRDPRDIICSLVDWLEKIHNYSNTEIFFKKKWFSLSRSEKIRLLIDVSLPRDYLNKYFKYKCEGMTLPERIRESVERAVCFNSLPQVLVVRFEDIVGDKGKGSRLAQLTAFEAINEYLNIYVEEDEFVEIINSLWGKEDPEQIHQPTFFKGYIGRWEEEFDDLDKAIMEDYYGRLISELGY